jgi:hypothetical protein
VTSLVNRARPERDQDIRSRTSSLHNRNIGFYCATFKRFWQP